MLTAEAAGDVSSTIVTPSASLPAAGLGMVTRCNSGTISAQLRSSAVVRRRAANSAAPAWNTFPGSGSQPAGSNVSKTSFHNNAPSALQSAARLRASAAGSVAEIGTTEAGDAAASTDSRLPSPGWSTHATGPPWLAVCVASNSSSAAIHFSRAGPEASAGSPIPRQSSTGGKGRTQARNPKRRNRRMSPVRSRRGLVAPLKSKSPGATWCQFHGMENSTARTPIFLSATRSRSHNWRGRW